jgi:catechol 2,3-dioxygenase-like lactoylglutathione lyase family enzyme
MPGTNSIIGGGGFHHVAIKVRDFERSIAFYQDVLGFRTKIAWTMGNGTPAAMLDTGDGNYLEVFGDPNFEATPNGAILHLALRTTDVDAATERCRAAGCKVTMEPKSLVIPAAEPTPVRISFVEAPEGVVIELFQNELT